MSIMHLTTAITNPYQAPVNHRPSSSLTPPPSIPSERLTPSRDPFHGLKSTSCKYARYLRHILKCAKDIAVINHGRPSYISLPHFIATALHRTPALNAKTPIAALLLLSRIRSMHPSVIGYATGHLLFITVYKIASKALHQKTYEDWSTIAQNVYSEQQIAELEFKLIPLLQDSLELNWIMISTFECLLSRDYGEEKKAYPAPYPAATLFAGAGSGESSSLYQPKLSLRFSREVIPTVLENKGLAESLIELQRQLQGSGQFSKNMCPPIAVL